MPCTFSSGKELEYAKNIKYIDAVYSSKEFLRFLISKEINILSEPRDQGVIIHLGGDIFYASKLVKKLNYPAYAYIWANKKYDKHFKGYFVRDIRGLNKLIKMGISKDKVHLAGDLLADNFNDEKKTNTNNEIFTLSFLPGSREIEIMALIPFYARTAELIKEKIKNIKFNIILSPFIDREGLFKNDHIMPYKGFEGVRVNLRPSEDKMVTDKIEMDICYNENFDAIKRSDFAVTLPGTKTAEGAIAGVPQLVIVPLNRAEFIPYVGFIGLLGYLGAPGKMLKARLIRIISKKFGFTALPNIIAGKEILPEMMQDLTPGEVAQKACNLINDKKKLKMIKEELIRVYEPLKGASDKMLKVISMDYK